MYTLGETYRIAEVLKSKKVIDVKGKFIDVSGLEDFAQQVSFLNHKLDKENSNMGKNVSSTSNAATKKGWLEKKGPKDWRKRWFVLRGASLSYFRNETDPEEAGSISLEGCEVGVEKNAKEEGKFPLKIVVGGRKLILQAESEDDRTDWIKVLNATANIKPKETEKDEVREDPRIATFLKSTTAPTLYLDDRPLQSTHLKSISDKISEHPELSLISISNAQLDDSKLKELAPSLKSAKLIKLGKKTNYLRQQDHP